MISLEIFQIQLGADDGKLLFYPRVLEQAGQSLTNCTKREYEERVTFVTYSEADQERAVIISERKLRPNSTSSSSNKTRS